MMRARLRNALASVMVLIITGLVTLSGGSAAEAAEEVVADLATRPDFRLPFGCGETWQLTYKTHHWHAAKQVDFYLPGERASAGYAVFPSAPGWVSELTPGNGEVEINHGGGWFTTYQHMTDISVSVGDYVGRGRVIGKVGNVGVDALWGLLDGPAHLHYEQAYQTGTNNAYFDYKTGPGKQIPYLEGESFDLSKTGTQIRTSTNNCAGGAPGGAVQFDVPNSGTLWSRSHATMEIFLRRSGDNALYERWYNGGWRGAPTGHTIVGQPAVAVFNHELHVIARRADNSIFDYVYNPFGGWRTVALAGQVTGDPDVAVHGFHKNLHVAARGTDGYLYHWWTNGDGSWSAPSRVDTVRVQGTPALFSHYDTFYIVGRADDGSVFSWEHDRRNTWRRWQLPGAAADNPDITVDPRTGKVNVVVRGTNDRIYRWVSKDPDWEPNHNTDGWENPELVDGNRYVAGAPAAGIYNGAMHIVARGRDNTVYHWWKGSTWHWEAPGGAYIGNPDITQFNRQFQTVGRGTDGNLYTVWFDPVTVRWNAEYQQVAAAE